jgi:hypothetical protein
MSLLPQEKLLNPCIKPLALSVVPENIQAPRAMHKQILEVINRYPELENTKIIFKYRSISTTMASRPAVNGNIFSKARRNYVISINKSTDHTTTFNFNSLEYEYQVAWIAHELGHIVDYKDRNVLSLAGEGLLYVLSKEFRGNVEAFAHRSAIYHGFGKQTQKSFDFVFGLKELPKNYMRAKLRENYLTPQRIREIVAEYDEASKKCPK